MVELADLGPDLSAAVALGGETGARFAAFDWAASTLGPPSSWPAEWRSAAATAVTSRFPIVLFLGPDLVLVYNDAYVPMLGLKHPAAMGTGAGKFGQRSGIRSGRCWRACWPPVRRPGRGT